MESAAVRLWMLSLLLLSSSVWAVDLTIAAASSYRPLLTELAAEFEQREGVSLRLVFASSGKLATQVQHGAPYDLYFSADDNYLQHLQQAGYLSGDAITDGYGQLVLWSAKAGTLPDSVEQLAGMKSVTLAIAQPRHAPFGKAAMHFLEGHQLADAVQGQLVYAENVAQAAQMALTGAADMALVALSVLPVEQRNNNQMLLLHMTDNFLLKQSHAVLKRAKNKTLAKQFSQFTQLQEFDQLKRKHGLITGTTNE
ncbi:molybdate ABC transporter substrate-binding protein [Idiomarina sp. HP20-50]|uniref:molybdate ABC transporter substrate-binding protein n=1 Tax=Idiomarina sp. HP20-50 TaxID=3070813 RepID=UPI00294AD56D|nr:molybdate ABC transporter substrate-binding protein [Idiomarina sp. HP20-50]MDV6316346.1 molybdate ABC transporter substrate-binding protein [Idiomarina sp. HP20-50]